MKKLLLFLALLTFHIIILQCSSTNDNVTELKPSKDFPQELVGYWKINNYKYLHDPNFGHDETAGYYIRIQSDRYVKYKDPNGEISGYAYVHSPNDFSLVDIGISISVSNSTKYPGQKEFIIKYNNEKIYYSGIMTGEKK